MAEQLTPEEIKAAFDAYNRELLLTGQVTKETAAAFNEAKTGIRNYTFQLNQSLKQLGTSVASLGTSMLKGEQGASVYNKSIEAGADAIDAFAAKFGFLGKLIGSLFTASARVVVEINKQGDALFKSYQDLSRAGAANAGGMTTVYQQMQQFGYNIEELGDFGKLIKENSQSLAILGGTVNQGVRQFGNLAEGIQRSGLQTQFMNMGMTIENMNTGMAGFLKIQNQTGSAARMNNQQLVQGAAKYIEQLDILTKLTGKSAETLISEQEANLADERYALVYRELKQKADAGDLVAQKELEQQTILLSQVQGETKTAVQNTLAGYQASSEAASKLFMTAPELSGMLAQKGGLAFEGAANQAMDMLKSSSTRTMDQFGELGKATGELGKTFISVKDMMGFEALKGTAEERMAAAKAEQAAQKANLDEATKNQVKMRQDQMETTRAAQNLINFGLNPVTAGMQKLAGGIESVTSKLPGTGATTGTSGSGRGGDPSGGGLFSRIFGLGGSAPGAGTTPPDLRIKPGAENKGSATDALYGVAQQVHDLLGGDYKYFSGFNDRSGGKHGEGKAFDIVLNDRNKYESALSQIKGIAGVTFAQFEPKGFKNPNGSVSSGDHIHAEVSAANGGIVTGPKSGYNAVLHGTEAVVPLSGGRSIPVEMPGLTASMSGQINMMAMQITKLDELIDAMHNNNDISSKILKASRA